VEGEHHQLKIENFAKWVARGYVIENTHTVSIKDLCVHKVGLCRCSWRISGELSDANKKQARDKDMQPEYFTVWLEKMHDRNCSLSCHLDVRFSIQSNNTDKEMCISGIISNTYEAGKPSQIWGIDLATCQVLSIFYRSFFSISKRFSLAGAPRAEKWLLGRKRRTRGH
jgi:hypothetical protein